MALATYAPGGDLKSLADKCQIYIPGHTINLRILPEISDTKKATYADQTIIGRSFPIKTYSHSDNRVVTMKLHFIVTKKDDIPDNLKHLRALESAVYPRRGDPYLPPPVCKIDCGDALGKDPLCVILESYNVSFPTNVAWDWRTMLPYYFQVSTTWHVVYASSNLPNQERIMSSGQ